MDIRRVLGAFALSWALLTAAHAQEASGDAACEAAYASLPPGAILDLLDPQAATGARAAALAGYQRLAAEMPHCPEFGYTLGQLYRHGEYLPGNLVAQDIAKARTLILPMAEAGYLPAYADLAEMEMRHAQAREAMKWTQVYLHFVDEVLLEGVRDGDALQYQRSAYNGNLLNRVELIWRYTRPTPPRKAVKEDLQAYLAAHGEAVEARMRARDRGQGLRASAQGGGATHAIAPAHSCYVNAIDRIGAGAASWIVEVLPSGKPGRVVLENFVPNPDVAGAMRDCLDRYTFAPFAGDAPATIRVSMVMGSPEGAAISCKRRR